LLKRKSHRSDYGFLIRVSITTSYGLGGADRGLFNVLFWPSKVRENSRTFGLLSEMRKLYSLSSIPNP